MKKTEMKRCLPWYRSMITKQIFIFVILLAPIYAACFTLYIWGSEAIRNEIEQSMEVQDTMMLNSLEEQIELLQGMQTDLFSDGDLLSLEGAPESYTPFERGNMALQVQDKLLMIYNSNRLIERVEVYIPSVRMKIGSFAIGAASDEEMEQLLAYTNGQPDHYLKFYGGKLHMLMLCRVYRKEGLPKYMVDITLSDNEINRMLAEMNPDKLSGAMLYREHDYHYFQGTPGLDQHLQSLVEGGFEQGRTTRNFGEASYFCNIAVSEQLNVKLMRCVPFSDTFQRLQTFNDFFSVLFVASTVIVVLFLFYFSGYIKRPLTALISAFQEFRAGNVKSKITYKRRDEFLVLAESFNQMTLDWEKMLENVYQQQVLVQKAELKKEM